MVPIMSTHGIPVLIHLEPCVNPQVRWVSLTREVSYGFYKNTSYMFLFQSDVLMALVETRSQVESEN